MFSSDALGNYRSVKVIVADCEKLHTALWIELTRFLFPLKNERCTDVMI